jgi:hypothetical protein
MSTEERLAQVERQLRWLKRLGALAIAVGAVVVLVGQAKEKEPEHLVVKSLKVVDKDGKVRAAATLSEDGSPSLFLSDKDGKAHVMITVMRNGSPLMAFSGTDGNSGAMLDVNGSWPTFTLTDQHGEGRFKASVLPNGTAILNLSDVSGEGGVSLRARQDTPGAVGLTDRDGTLRATLSLDTDGSPGIAMHDANGKVIWKAPGE